MRLNLIYEFFIHWILVNYFLWIYIIGFLLSYFRILYSYLMEVGCDSVAPASAYR